MPSKIQLVMLVLLGCGVNRTRTEDSCENPCEEYLERRAEAFEKTDEKGKIPECQVTLLTPFYKQFEVNENATEEEINKAVKEEENAFRNLSQKKQDEMKDCQKSVDKALEEHGGLEPPSDDCENYINKLKEEAEAQ